MKVSIIIPIYNVANYIERCLVSVINQTYRNIEILLIDDCGSDESTSIAKKVISEYHEMLSYRFLYHSRNRGLSAARNTGIEAAHGEYIYFLDSDDEITLDCIEILVAVAQKQKVDLILSNYSVLNTTNNYPPLNLSSGLVDNNAEILSSYLKGDWYGMAVNKLIKLDFIKENNLLFKEGLLYEDTLWSFQMALELNSMYVIKEKKTYNYYIRPDSITTIEFSKRHFDSLEEIIVGMVKTVRGSKHSNYDIINFIESHKSGFLRRILISNQTDSYKYKAYMIFRNFRVLPFDIDNKTARKKTLRKIVRDFHYSLPAKLGFLYYKAILLSMKEK